VTWVGGKFISNSCTPLFDKTKKKEKKEKQRMKRKETEDIDRTEEW
jgi:hypothetical protein